MLTRRASLRPKRAKPRTWRCAHCGSRSTGTVCASCHIRRATKRTSLKARCDALARALCRKLADGKCARCGGVGTDWAHRFPRRHHVLRWSMENCDLLCRACHRYFTDYPASFTRWLIDRIGDQVLDDLEQRVNEPWDRDYSRVLTYLREYRS